MGLSWQELTEMPLDLGEESSLAPLTQVAVELSKTPAEALSRLMAKEFLRRKGGGEFFYEGGSIAKNYPQNSYLIAGNYL